MTSPAPQQPPPPADLGLTEAAAAALATYGTGSMVFTALRGPFGGAGIRPLVLMAVIDLVTNHPQEPLQGVGPASKYAVRANIVRRASFLVQAARRVQAASTEARSKGESRLEAVQRAIEFERRYFSQHTQACWHRTQAGAIIDSAAGQYGTLLGWKSVRDSRVTRDCQRADGMNFRATAPPVIGYPGMVHGNCRCYPVAPWPRGRLMRSMGAAA